MAVRGYDRITSCAEGETRRPWDTQVLWVEMPGSSSTLIFMERFNLVFVYGTLKRGRYNCDRMKGVYLCDATTLQRFPLIVRYSLPYLLDLPNDGLNVEGELYGVTDDDLEYLDHLEGVPSHYQRKSVHVFTEENLYVAWSYFAVYPYDITNANLKSKY